MFLTSNNQEEKGEHGVWPRVDMFGPRTLFNDYTRFTSYQIYLRNGDHSIHGSWNEKDGFLIRDEIIDGEWTFDLLPFLYS